MISSVLRSFCNSMGIVFSIVFCCMLALCPELTEIAVADDKLRLNQVIDDSGTLISAGKNFQLGFFTPGNSKNRWYLGIWYSNIPDHPPTVVWVANRNSPLNDSSGVLKISDDGNLIILDKTNRVSWSSGVWTIPSKPTFAQLLDSGNFVLRSEISTGSATESYIWQSFDHPSDTLLPGMKLGWDLRIGLNRYLTSWRSPDDPSPGDLVCSIELNGLPQGVIRRNSVKQFRSTGALVNRVQPNSNPLFSSRFINNSEEVYYVYGPYYKLTRLVLNYTGNLQRLVWENTSHEWIVISAHPSDLCDSYGRCGSNAICTINNPQICSCLAGYTPKSSQDWRILIWSDGCVSKSPLNCPEGEGFIQLKGVETPDLLQFSMNSSMTKKECEEECLKNCSCRAYSHSAVGGRGNGCLLWFGDLIDMKRYSDSSDNLHIRVTASELGSKKKQQLIMSVMIPVSVAFFLFLLVTSIVCKRRRSHKQGSQSDIISKGDGNIDLPIFSVITIVEATNNFSHSNKIGEGGFGSVYKGQLPTGQEIAVKRLSENSTQGLHEFKNEVILISKLQHRNLVRLLGCCIHGEERMLIYEYMPNGSLSSFIFDNRSKILVWSTRFNIIVGIARGLLYLHRDSRLRIIHRDLKTSNVLLDTEMNPKISDFGIARAFRGDQLSEKTQRVIGTYGYMSPEYVIHGLFSIKSDVFSFGVLVLEIVGGRRNREFFHADCNFTLLALAWKLWNEGKAFELEDERMEDRFPISKLLKCIQIGLLCVQQHPEDRPTMSSVLLWLDSDSAVLPQPKQPAFYPERSTIERDQQCATNSVTLTLPEGR